MYHLAIAILLGHGGYCIKRECCSAGGERIKHQNKELRLENERMDKKELLLEKNKTARYLEHLEKDAAAFSVSVATTGSRCTMVVKGGDTVGEANLVSTREVCNNP